MDRKSPPSPRPALRTRELSRFPPGRGPEVLCEVDLEVPEGSFFGLVGANGAGKSTLLRMLLGLAPIGAGQAEIFGEPVPGRRSREGVGYLPDEADALPGLTTRDHLQLFARLEGLRGREAHLRIRGVLEENGLLEVADQAVRVLSKGLRQRVELARLFLVPRRLYILDEPFTALDAVHQIALEERLRERVSEGATVLWTSHRYRALADLSSHVALLRAGRLVEVGTTEEVLGGRSWVELLTGGEAPHHSGSPPTPADSPREEASP